MQPPAKLVPQERTIRCMLLGKPHQADQYDKPDVLYWDDVPEWVRVKDETQDREMYGPDWAFWEICFPWLLIKDRIWKGRFIFTVEINGKKTIWIEVADCVLSKPRIVPGVQETLLDVKPTVTDKPKRKKRAP